MLLENRFKKNIFEIWKIVKNSIGGSDYYNIRLDMGTGTTLVATTVASHVAVQRLLTRHVLVFPFFDVLSSSHLYFGPSLKGNLWCRGLNNV